MITIKDNVADINRQQWNDLVKASSVATWFQTPEAYDFFASVPEEMTPFVVAVQAESELRAVCVGYVTKEKKPLKQFLTARAIIIGGPLLANDCADEEVMSLLKAIETHLSELGRPIYIETRNFNDYSRWKPAFERCGWKYLPHLNFHLNTSNKDEMMANMSESKRRQIKKSIKNGAIIEEVSSEDELKQYYNILLALYKTKVKTPLFSFGWFLNFYQKNMGKCFVVKKEEKVIGGIICPILKERIIYEWFVCGLDSEYKDIYPSVMATYAAMDYATHSNIKMFDFMGAGTPDASYGVREFKERFGGELVEHGRFNKVCKPLLYEFGKLGVKIMKKL